MPSLEQCFDWNKRLHSVIIARSRSVCTRTIRMTLRYVEVIQPDLQREFHLARQNAPLHRLPTLPIPAATLNSDLVAIHQAIAATRHVLEMYRRSFPDEKICRKLQRPDRRLLAIANHLDHIAKAEK
jgi:hypothetical protein